MTTSPNCCGSKTQYPLVHHFFTTASMTNWQNLRFLLFFVLLHLNGTKAFSRRNEESSTTSPRIIGGRDAIQGRYPYTVSIQRASSLLHFCSGSLIAPDLVLTTASCRFRLSNTAIRTNPYRLNLPQEGSEIFSVLDFRRHPEYFEDARRAQNFMVLKINGTSSQPWIRINTNRFIPVDGQPMKSSGWGTIEPTRRIVYPDVQQEMDGTYLNTRDCANSTQGEDFTLDEEAITNDMMCVIHQAGQACNGDVGNPVVVPDMESTDDILVGLIAWGDGRCSTGSPVIAARVSAAYDFIRTSVCILSDAPPDYFQCPLLVTSAPTEAPDIPAPTPTGQERTAITVQVILDGAPEEVGWKIETLSGYVVAEVLPGTYTIGQEFETISTVVNVTKGMPYNLVLTDIADNGFCCDGDGWVNVFLGARVDFSKVLVQNDFFFGDSNVDTFIADESGIIPPETPFPSPKGPRKPSFSPTTMVSDTLEVSVLIYFDTYPVQTSWTISHPNGRIVAEGGPYSPFLGSSVTDVVHLENNREHVFTIFDTRVNLFDDVLPGNGLCCEDGMGNATVYLGSPDQGQALVFDDGMFGDNRSQTFNLSAASTFAVTSRPSSSPTITVPPTSSPAPSRSFQDVFVVIFLDYGPEDTTWEILDASDESIVYEGGPYNSTFSREVVTTTVTLRLGGEYIFVIYDRFGGGLCCDSFAAVYLGGIADESNVLVYESGDFGEMGRHSFVASPEGFIEVTSAPTPVRSQWPTRGRTVSPRPTPSPTPAPTLQPSSTLFPTGYQVPVTVELTLDGSPWETGWRILRAVDRRVVYDVPPGAYSSSPSGQVVVEVVSLDRDREYIFELIDTDPDGICCVRGIGRAFIYLGTERTVDRVLLFDDGQFGRLHWQFFVVNEGGLLGFTSRPSSSIPSRSPSISWNPTFGPTSSHAPSTSQSPSVAINQILISIQFDRWPQETRWNMTDSGGAEVASGGNYFSGERSVNEIIDVQPGAQYTFRILDNANDGICCRFGNGFVIIYLGSEPSEDMVLVYEFGDFGSEAIHTFVAAPAGIIDNVFPTSSPAPTIATDAPTNGPTLTSQPTGPIPRTDVLLDLLLDRSPDETGWSIVKSDGSEGPVASVLPGEYGVEYSEKKVRVVFSLELGASYNFTLLDSAGDGLTTGNGLAFIFLGNYTSRSNLLMHENGNIRFERTKTFVASPEGIIPYPGGGTFCFSGNTVVRVKRKKEEDGVMMESRVMKMRELRIGDEVQVGNDQYERVYGFGHYAPDRMGMFLSVKVHGMSSPLEISEDHLMFVVNGGGVVRAVPASLLSVGDEVLLGSGGIGWVESIGKERLGHGLFAPFTSSGRVVVNGIVVSTFVSLQRKEERLVLGGWETPLSHQWLAHSFEGPHRWVCGVVRSVCEQERYDREGVSLWVSSPREWFMWLLEAQGNKIWSVVSVTVMMGLVVPVLTMCSLLDNALVLPILIVLIAWSHFKQNSKKKKSV